MSVQGGQAGSGAAADVAKGPGESAMAEGKNGNGQATDAAGQGTEGGQTSMVSSMQSIESAIVFNAMQRISSLFQHEQVPNSGGVDALMADAAIKAAAAVQTGWLPGSGGSSAFVPLGKGAEQGTSEGHVTAKAAAVPSQTFPTLNQQTDGAFCGDSDVVGEVQKVHTPMFPMHGRLKATAMRTFGRHM